MPEELTFTWSTYRLTSSGVGGIGFQERKCVLLKIKGSPFLIKHWRGGMWENSQISVLMSLPCHVFLSCRAGRSFSRRVSLQQLQWRRPSRCWVLGNNNNSSSNRARMGTTTTTNSATSGHHRMDILLQWIFKLIMRILWRGPPLFSPNKISFITPPYLLNLPY